MSPLLRPSRMAAQLASLLTVELMPCLRKKPFSWAMTMGEQSVSAMMPNFMSMASFDAEAGGVSEELQPLRSDAEPRPAAAAPRKRRRFIFADEASAERFVDRIQR